MHDRSGINAFTKTIGYGYDAVHNRIGSMQQPGDWQYNADNQLVQFGAGTDQTTYTYTANGHVATKTEKGQTLTYTYDATNRLISIADTIAGGTEIARYAYDPMGRRISKTVNEEITYYLYVAEGLIAELDKTGNMTVAYGWQADAMYGTAPLWQAQVTGSDLQTADYHYLITDHLGTPQLAVNSSGQTTWKAYSEAFGNTTPDATNQITMNLRFPGQYFDQETNTHYNYFRDYNPVTGRYVQKDPIGLNGGINLYGYAAGNPLSYYDPQGKFIPLAIAAGYAAEAIVGGIIIIVGWYLITQPDQQQGDDGDYIGGHNLGGQENTGWEWPWGKPKPEEEECLSGTINNPTNHGQVGDNIINAKPPENAYDPDGPKAPGKPGEEEGFESPKGGDNWVSNPNGRGDGWQDKGGRVWVPTGPGGDAHGGPHWDVQTPGKGGRRGPHDNIYPGGRRR